MKTILLAATAIAVGRQAGIGYFLQCGRHADARELSLSLALFASTNEG